MELREVETQREHTNAENNKVNKINPTAKLETLDDALSYVGDFNKYQYFLLLGLLPYIFGYGSLYFSQFFLTLTPNEYWCKVDELVQKNLSAEERYT